MPIIHLEHTHKDLSWCIWKIEESVDTLLQTAHLSDQEFIEFQRYHHIKRKEEWLGARNAISSLLRQKGYDYSGIEKDEYDKPWVHKGSCHISLAHSYPLAVAMVHENQPCGIDIEKIKPSLTRVSSRFLNEHEISSINQNVEGLCIAWTAKESLYKLYGKIPLSFKNQMFLHPFPVNHEGEVRATVSFGGIQKEHRLIYRRIEDYYICFNR
jgi:phosphopantetheinyl transferase